MAGAYGQGGGDVYTASYRPHGRAEDVLTQAWGGVSLPYSSTGFTGAASSGQNVRVPPPPPPKAAPTGSTPPAAKAPHAGVNYPTKASP
eukprot:11948855-Prorocentrum_lima.AAC.1